MDITDEEVRLLNEGLRGVRIDQLGKRQEKIAKQIDEHNRQHREQRQSMRNTNGKRKPKTFNEIYAETKASQPTVQDIYEEKVRRQQNAKARYEQEQREGERLWLEQKGQRDNAYAHFRPYANKAGARFSQDSVDALEDHVSDLQATADRHARELKQKANDLTELWRSEGQGPAYS